jgi:hypothetical protein
MPGNDRAGFDCSGSFFQSRSRSRLKIIHQTLIQNFHSRSAGFFPIRVCLQKVKLIPSSNSPGITTEFAGMQPVFPRRSPEFFQSKSAGKKSIRICVKNEKQSLIDPDQ